MPHLPFFLASFAWNYGLGMTYIVVPLHAHGLGLSAAEIGLLFSLPVFAQVALNLVGGAWSDRVGGRRIMLASCGLLVIAALGFAAASGFRSLFAAQLLMVLSRAAFWPANWSLASELPGERAVQLARLNAATNLAQIAGTGSCGFVLALAGFTPTFLVLAGAGAAALLLGFRVAQAPRPAPAAWPGMLASYRPLLGMRIIWYAMLCAYVSALPFTLSMSFYPLLLKHYGYGEEASGALIALRAVGAICAGLLAARFVRTGPASRWPIGTGLMVAIGVGLMPAVNHPAAIGALLLLVGVGSGVMTLYFQITMSEASALESRGSALALGGLGWGLSHLTTPLLMGLLTERYGVVSGYYLLGLLALATVATIALLRHWAFAQTRLAGT